MAVSGSPAIRGSRAIQVLHSTDVLRANFSERIHATEPAFVQVYNQSLIGAGRYIGPLARALLVTDHMYTRIFEPLRAQESDGVIRRSRASAKHVIGRDDE